MALGGKIYNIFFKRTSTFLLTLGAGVFIFERGADGFADYVFDKINEGKQWKDVRASIEKQQE